MKKSTITAIVTMPVLAVFVLLMLIDINTVNQRMMNTDFVLRTVYGYNITDPRSEDGTDVNMREAFLETLRKQGHISNETFAKANSTDELMTRNPNANTNTDEAGKLKVNATERAINKVFPQEALEPSDIDEYRNCITAFVEDMFVQLTTSSDCSPEQLAEAVTHFKISGYPHESSFMNTGETISLQLQSAEMHPSK